VRDTKGIGIFEVDEHGYVHPIDELDLDLIPEPEGLAVIPPSRDAGPCCNDCIFCYIRQNPPEVLRRNGGKVDTTKHDTLNDPNLEERVEKASERYPELTFRIVDTAGNVGLDAGRIEDLASRGLDEIQISVHTAVPETRCELMRNPNADRLLELLPAFEDVGVRVIADLVLTPGYNLEELPFSLRRLDELGVSEIRVFPVGGTDLAEGFRFPTEGEVRWILRVCDEVGGEVESEVRPSPTLRALLGEPVEDPPDLPEPDVYTYLVTGELAAPVFEPAVEGLDRVELVVVKNRVFGGVIGAAGLLTAGDVLRELESLNPPEEPSMVILPDAMFGPDGVTLDGVGKDELIGRLAGMGFLVEVCRTPDDVAAVLSSPVPTV